MTIGYAECYCTYPEEITQMNYIGEGKWKCPKCATENDCHEVVYKLRLKFTKDEADDYVKIEILESYEPRLEKDDLKSLIETEFAESEFEEHHKIGVFDCDLLFNPYHLSDENGTEYYLDMFIVQEVELK